MLKKNNLKHLKAQISSDSINVRNNFFLHHIHENIRLIFNYYNFLQDYKNHINKLEILNKYFNNKKLLEIHKKDLSLPLTVKNITVFQNQNYLGIDAKLKVSIILTAYNIEYFITISINSLLEQTYTNIEIIVVDDDSTDKTLEKLKQFKSSHKIKIKLINLKKNYGAYIAKNIALSYCTGDLITFHDADDWAHPQRIEEHVKAHQQNKKVKFSISKLVRITEDGTFYAKEIYPLDRLSMISLMINKSLIDEIGYFRTYRLGSDTEYFERIKKFTKHKFERIDKVLMFCSHRENSLTTSPETGVIGFGKTNKRKHYWNQWHKWHEMLKKSKRKPYIDFDRTKYQYEIIN